MNNNPATVQQTTMSKRTRFSDDTSHSTSSKTNADKLRSPKEAASTFTRSTFASLNPKLTSILMKTSDNHLNLLHKLFEKKRQHERMTTDTEFIPSSARIKEFEFYVRKEVEHSQDFKAIQEITREGIQKHRLFLKEQILSVMAIDIALLEKNINDDYLKSLDIALRGHLISLQKSPDERHRYLTEIFKNNHDLLLTNTTMPYEDFCARYEEFAECDKFPLEDVAQPVTSPHFGGGPNGDTLRFQQQSIAIRDTCVPILALLKSLLVTPFERYTETVSQNDLNLNLKKLDTEHFLEKSTSDTSMMIDIEDSADKTQLRELIRQENNIANKKLCDEIANLKKQIASTGVKGQRGPQKSGGASLKKQIPSTPSSNAKSSSRKKKGNKNAQKAGDHDKGTSAAEKKRAKKKSGQNTTRKSRPSRTDRK